MYENDEPILPDGEIETVETEANQVEAETVEQETAEETEVKTEETKVEEEKQTEDAKVDEPEQTLKVKYLKEERELSLEEAVKYAQLGLNEERLSNKYKAELDGLQDTKNVIAELAKLNNISEADAIRNLKESIEKAKIEEIKANADIPDDVAKELLEARRIKAEYAEKQKAEESNKEFTDFVKDYPNVKAEEIPQEVWDVQKEGVPLKYAYQSYLLNQIQKENQILKQNASNSEKANIPATTANIGKVEVKDDFMTGFDSEL